MKALLINPESVPHFWDMAVTTKLQGAKVLGPPLGLITMAAMLPSSWDLRLVDLDAEPITEDHWSWAELIMVTGMLSQRKSIRAVIAEAKKRGLVVVAGGPYTTSLGEEVIAAGADFLVKGEAETVIDELTTALERGDEKGVFEAAEKPDLSHTPIPKYDLLNLDFYAHMQVQTSRGCPFDCEFCDITNLFGRKPRYKSPDQVMAELEHLRKIGWDRAIFFCDDNLIGDKKRIKMILKRLIPWMDKYNAFHGFTCQASIDLADHLDIIDMMTAASFSDVLMGLETPDEEALLKTNKKQNLKRPLSESVEIIQRNGLTVTGSFVIGFDGESQGVGRRISQLVEDAAIPMPAPNVLMAIPNTRLWDRLKVEGRLTSDLEQFGMCGATNVVLARPKEDVFNEYMELWEYLYDPVRYMERAYRHIMEVRPTRKALIEGKYKKRGGNGKPAPEWRIPTDYSDPDNGFAPKLKANKVTRRLFSKEILISLRVLWELGGRPQHRFRFWKLSWLVWRNNPSRLVKFIILCASGLNFFEFRKDLRNRMETELRDKEQDPQPEPVLNRRP